MKLSDLFPWIVTGTETPVLELLANRVVNVTYTSYAGTAPHNGITQWLGIRYAAPPLGDWRFAPPQDPPVNYIIQPADTVGSGRGHLDKIDEYFLIQFFKHGKLCVASQASPSDQSTSEDCLFLDIYAPTTARPNSNLPVFVFIQGGGFNSLSNPNYNASGLIEASGHNIIVVTFNYRVGPYGFLTDGNLLTANNGLRDQRKVFQWIQKYIHLFGGNSSHVVLGGDSAGAGSISLHLVADGGKNEGLFHAAAAESVSFPTVLTVNESQYQFNNFAGKLGCTGAGADAISCLRSKSTAELQEQNQYIAYPYPGVTGPPVYMWNPVVDGDLIKNVTYASFQTGNFINVPLIIGDDTNGGTTFAPSSTATLADSNHFLKNTFPFLTDQHFATLNSLYPKTDVVFPNSGSYWRQLSDVYGEGRYMCPGLFISSTESRVGKNNSWVYRWNVEDPAQMASGLGVPHTVEVSAIWGPNYVSGPASYSAGGVNAPASPVIQAYWTSFIRTFNPNTYRYPGSAEWVAWSDEQKNRLLFETGGSTTMEALDDGLQARCSFWASIGSAIRQ